MDNPSVLMDHPWTIRGYLLIIHRLLIDSQRVFTHSLNMCWLNLTHLLVIVWNIRGDLVEVGGWPKVISQRSIREPPWCDMRREERQGERGSGVITGSMPSPFWSRFTGPTRVWITCQGWRSSKAQVEVHRCLLRLLRAPRLSAVVPLDAGDCSWPTPQNM